MERGDIIGPRSLQGGKRRQCLRQVFQRVPVSFLAAEVLLLHEAVNVSLGRVGEGREVREQGTRQMEKKGNKTPTVPSRLPTLMLVTLGLNRFLTWSITSCSSRR